jgi:multiple sugar transport system permease protein
MTTQVWNLARILRLGLLSVGAFVFLLPYAWMLSTAMKPREEIFSSSLALIPERWAVVENFSKAFTRVPMLLLLTNDIIVCAVILVVQVAVALPCAGALMAATVVVTVPLLLAFLFAQRRFIEGITLTGLKG